MRRDLIIIGEDMVNVAYDSPVDMPPEKQIEDGEQRLYGLAEKGKYGSGFMTFSHRARRCHRHGLAAPMSGRAACRAFRPACAISTGRWAGCRSSDLLILAGRPSMGKTALATNIAFNVAKAYRTETNAMASRRCS